MAAFIPHVSLLDSSTHDASRFGHSSLQLTPAASLFVSADVSPLVTPATTRTFEPILPDTGTLIGFGVIVVLCVAAVYVWANQVVPVSRTNLAISKRSGAVRDYLDELEAAKYSNTTTINSRDFERWLFTDWLEKKPGKAGRQKEPALPILKNAKWNSGDNPVLVASALIGLGVVMSSITERVISAF